MNSKGKKTAITKQIAEGSHFFIEDALLPVLIFLPDLPFGRVWLNPSMHQELILHRAP